MRLVTDRRKPAGFSVAELITVVAIVGILASVAIPVARLATRRHKEILLRARLSKITAAIDRYSDLRGAGVIKARAALQQETYPRTLEELTETIDLIDGKRVRLLRKGDLVDPITGRSEWQTRSSTDDEDSSFSNGDNVWEIHSTSTALSLDGKTRYNEW